MHSASVFVEGFAEAVDSGTKRLWFATNSDPNVLWRLEKPTGHDGDFIFLEQPSAKFFDIHIS